MLRTTLKRVMPARLQSLARSALYRNHLARFKRRIVERQFGDLRLKAVITDRIAAEWYDRDRPPLPWIVFLKQHSLKPGALLFDLGAHQAIVALILADTVSPGGRVVAVEANPHNAEIAAQNVELNEGAVTVLNCAIAAKNGSITFNKGLNGQVDDGEGTHGMIEVPSRTIDSLTAEYGQPDILFIDVEGFECEALKGASQTLERRCDVFVEVHGGCGLEKFGGSIDSLLGFFPTNRYDLFYSPDEEWSPFKPLDVRALSQGTHWCLIALDKRRPNYSGFRPFGNIS